MLTTALAGWVLVWIALPFNKEKMEEVSSKEARDHIASLLNNVAFGEKHYTLTRQQLEDAEDIRDADAAMEYIKKGEATITHKALKRDLGL